MYHNAGYTKTLWILFSIPSAFDFAGKSPISLFPILSTIIVDIGGGEGDTLALHYQFVLSILIRSVSAWEPCRFLHQSIYFRASVLHAFTSAIALFVESGGASGGSSKDFRLLDISTF